MELAGKPKRSLGRSVLAVGAPVLVLIGAGKLLNPAMVGLFVAVDTVGIGTLTVLTAAFTLPLLFGSGWLSAYLAPRSPVGHALVVGCIHALLQFAAIAVTLLFVDRATETIGAGNLVVFGMAGAFAPVVTMSGARLLVSRRRVPPSGPVSDVFE